jgi:helix-turn-helix protein
VAGLLHATVVGVRLGDNVVELLDGLIAKDLVAELLSDLRKETSLDKRGRAVVDTGLGLEEDTSQHTIATAHM